MISLLMLKQDEKTKGRSYRRYREWVSTQHSSVLVAHKAGVIVAGIVVILVGFILIPLPGPGWLIVFFGVSILGLEFPVFGRFTAWIRGKARSLWRRLRPSKNKPKQKTVREGQQVVENPQPFRTTTASQAQTPPSRPR